MLISPSNSIHSSQPARRSLSRRCRTFQSPSTKSKSRGASGRRGRDMGIPWLENLVPASARSTRRGSASTPVVGGLHLPAGDGQVPVGAGPPSIQWPIRPRGSGPWPRRQRRVAGSGVIGHEGSAGSEAMRPVGRNVPSRSRRRSVATRRRRGEKHRGPDAFARRIRLHSSRTFASCLYRIARPEALRMPPSGEGAADHAAILFMCPGTV